MSLSTYPELPPVLDAGDEGDHEEDEEDPAQNTDQAEGQCSVPSTDKLFIYTVIIMI